MFIYYVYAYMSNGLPYYIGKGKGRRAFQKHKNVPVPTDKKDIIFLEKNLSNIGALALERRMISWYGRLDIRTGILLNKTDGGESGTIGYKLSEDQKSKISVAHKGKLVSTETRKRISDSEKGKSVSTESRKRMSDAKKGKPAHNKGTSHSSAARKKMRDAKKNISDETRKKMSDSKKGKVLSAEHRKKLSDAQKGKSGHMKGNTHSPEARKKISESHKGISAETRKKMIESRKANLLKASLQQPKYHS